MKIYIPASRLERLKFRYAPRWLTKRWPVKLVELTVSIPGVITLEEALDASPMNTKKNLPN